MRRVCMSAGMLCALAGTAAAQEIRAQLLVGGLVRPVYVTAPPGDTARLFIVEQRGSGGTGNRADIRIYKFGVGLNAAPFLSITGVSTGSEQGLLGMAFDPNYASNGYFYVNYTNASGTTIIARYRVSSTNPDLADPTTATTVLSVAQPFTNHNAGWLGFGPDGYLYIPLGDGGSAGDPQNHGQNLNSLLGKVLRIDVSSLPYTIPSTNPFYGSTSARQEIWAYGLRNPWRCSFDRLTGDFWIGDVGQNAREEVNFQPAATTPPFTARNYGWRCYEGNNTYNTTGCPPASTMVFPVYDYPNPAQGCSVIGGYVYRGCDIPNLRGTYFFADYCSSRFWSFRYVSGTMTEFRERTSELAPSAPPSLSAPSSFGEDANGEMYIVSLNGNVFRVVQRCYANCDGSTTAPVLNVADFTCFLQRFAAGDCWANCDGSTTVPVLNVADFTCFLQRFAAGCP